MIICVGEILVDMIGEYHDNVFSYQRRAGGAPFNVSCAIAKFGGISSFYGAVGDDIIGNFLIDYIEKHNVINHIKIIKKHNTTLAFVNIDEKGERSFCFYRYNTADIYLPSIKNKDIINASIIHLGSLLLSNEKGIKYCNKLIKQIKDNHKLLSFDVNYREDIFKDKNAAINKYKLILEQADIIKLSEEEIKLERNTNETQISLEINLDGTGKAEIQTGIGFFDHMLTLLAFHSEMDIKMICHGDLEVDSHHSVEDMGIALGKTILEALGDKKGITRYGHFIIPMDEALVTCNLDISGRSFLVFNVDIPKVNLGNYESEMTEEFFRAVAYNMNATLHINEAYGNNVHHVIEACFKAFGRALKEAVRIDEKNKDKVISSKGVL